MSANAIGQFRAEMRGHGPSYHPGDLEIIADGRLHRFHAADDRAGKRNAWYVLHANARPAGAFGNWRTGDKFSWRAESDVSRILTVFERADIQREQDARAKQEKIDREHAKQRAGKLWQAAKPADPGHPYLLHKKAKPNGLRQLGDKLVVPLPVDGELVGLQFIDIEGNKRFMRGSAPAGAYFMIGTSEDRIVVAEGFATAAAIYESTNIPTVVAFNAGNLLLVTKALHKQYPDAHIIVAADDDVETKGNPGITYATVAAQAVNGTLAFPLVNAERAKVATDFNDLLVQHGIGAVKAAIDAATKPLSRLGGTTEDNKSTVVKLAALNPIEYDQARVANAKALGIRAETLDTLVKAERPKVKRDETSGEVVFDDIKPWHDAVNGAALLDELAAIVTRFIVLPKHADAVIALWILFTYCVDSASTAPILAVTSPEKRCGKTTLMELLIRLTSRALPSSNISPSALFRSIESWHPTLVIDEGDSFLGASEEMRGILNSGHTRQTAFVLRTVGDDHEPRRFSTWGAKAIARIGRLSDTLHDRSIVIELRRKLPDEKREKLRHVPTATFETLRRRCERFASDHGEALKRARPAIPEELHDRAADNWEPLLAIGDLAGGKWPVSARDAALALSGVVADNLSVNVELLVDVAAAFEAAGTDRMASADLVAALVADETKRWATFNKGKPMSPRQLASRLSQFGGVPVAVRFDDERVLKGYRLEKLVDALARYGPPPSQEKHRYSPSQPCPPEDFGSTTKPRVLRIGKPPRTASTNTCDGVADAAEAEDGGRRRSADDYRRASRGE